MHPEALRTGRHGACRRAVRLLACVVALLGSQPVQAQPLGTPRYLVVDEQDKRLYGYDADGTPTGSVALDPANTRPQGIGGDLTTIYVVDAGLKQVFRYDATGAVEARSRVLRTPTGGSLGRPTGVSLDAEDLWILDRGRRAIYRYGLAEAFGEGGKLSANHEILLSPANSRAEGLAADADWLYVLDESDRQVYRYIRDYSGPVFASRVMRRSDGSSLGAPAGLTVVDTQLLVVDRSRDKILQYDLDELFAPGDPLAADGESPLDPANGDARGLHDVLEGTTQVAEKPFPQEVIDRINKERTDRKLPALTLSTKLQQAAQTHNNVLIQTDKSLTQLRNERLDGHQLPGERPLLHNIPLTKLEDTKKRQDRLTAVGYRWMQGGENVGESATPAAQVAAWMASTEGHREQILDPGVTEIGVAHGTTGTGKSFFTAVFGKEFPAQ